MNILTSEELSDYERDGFIIVRNLFSEEEINLLGQTARADNEMDKSSSSMDDGEGNAVRLALWNHPGDGIYGMIARCHKLVDRVEDLLDDELLDAENLELAGEDPIDPAALIASIDQITPPKVRGRDAEPREGCPGQGGSAREGRTGGVAA